MNQPASTPDPTQPRRTDEYPTRPTDSRQWPASRPTVPTPRQARLPRPSDDAINAAQLADIAELLDLLDGFLRHADGIADRLADYLHATGRDHPQPPHWAGYNANLLIDQVSFTAHALRAHRREPLQ